MGMACPECGAPIGASTHGDLLAYADPDWLDRLRKGTSLKLWNIVLGMVSAVTAWVLERVQVPGVVQIFVALPAEILGLWAAFLITTQEPRISLAEDPVTLRKVVRGCAIVGFIGNVLQVLSENVGLGVSLSMVVALGGVFILVGIASYLGEFIYFRRFARRLPNDRLTRDTTVVMWGVVIGLGSFVLFGLIVALAGPAASGRAVGAVATLPLCGSLLALGVFGIWYIVLLLQYRLAFSAVAYQARQVFDVGQPPPEPSGAGSGA